MISRLYYFQKDYKRALKTSFKLLVTYDGTTTLPDLRFDNVPGDLRKCHLSQKERGNKIRETSILITTQYSRF